MSDTVGQHMSTPPIVANAAMKTGEAAAIMLARKIHRLPVVDEEGRFIGWVLSMGTLLLLRCCRFLLLRHACPRTPAPLRHLLPHRHLSLLCMLLMLY